jgi:uncharacterized protein YaiL (DUF2058 family)
VSKSLQEQLLELGLAKKPAAPPKGHKGKPHRKKDATVARAEHAAQREPSLEEAFRLREQQEEAEARRAREKKQAEDRRRHELNRVIKEIVEPNRLNDPLAEEARYFMYKGRIRKVHVTPQQLESLNENRLGIVYLAGGYHLLAPDLVEAVRRISPEHVPDLGGVEEGADPADS